MMLPSILEKIIEAKYTRSRNEILKKINVKIEQFRFMNRLAYDLKVLATNQYGYASANLDEIGKMLGAWIKQQARL